MGSMRRRLIVAIVGMVTLVLMISGVLLFRAVQRRLWTEFDRGLATTAAALAALVEREDDQIEMEFDARQMPAFAPGPRAEYFCLSNERGHIVESSPSLAGGRALPIADIQQESPRFDHAALPDGRPGRIIRMSFQPRQEGRRRRQFPPLRLTVARETAPIDDAISYLRNLLIGVCGGAALVAGGSAAFIIRGGMRPLQRLENDIGGIEADSLQRRLDTARLPRELRASLNAMLDRLQAAVERERALTADIAHELRTPLAGLQAAMEVALDRPRTPAEYGQTLARCLQITRSSHVLVENLLTLARSDAGRLPIARETFDLPDLLRQCWARQAERAAARELAVAWRLPQPCPVTSDREKLRIILNNLLDNAVSYAPAGSVIRVGLRAWRGRLALRIVNDGCQVAAVDAPRVFDRFWRGEAARTQTGIHCGLGLPLARNLLQALDGQIVVKCTLGGRFRVLLRLASEPGPRLTSAPPAAEPALA